MPVSIHGRVFKDYFGAEEIVASPYELQSATEEL
jgi:hypothetical protein